MTPSGNLHDEHEFIDMLRADVHRVVLTDVPLKLRCKDVDTDTERDPEDYDVEDFSDLETPMSEDEMEEEYADFCVPTIKNWNGASSKERIDQARGAETMREADHHAKALADAYLRGYSEGGDLPRERTETQVQKDLVSEQQPKVDRTDSQDDPRWRMYLREHSESVSCDPRYPTLTDDSGLTAEILEFEMQAIYDKELAEAEFYKQTQAADLTSLRSQIADFVSEYIDSVTETLQQTSFVNNYNLGSNFRATMSHQALTKFIGARKGWKVTPSAYDVDNAFVAEYDSGCSGTNIGIDVEYDMAEFDGSHYSSLTALTSVSAALAIAAAIEKFKLPGKVVLFGIPSKGKSKFIQAGAYSTYRINMSLLSSPQQDCAKPSLSTNHEENFQVEYFGNEEIDALDAMITAYNAVGVLRRQLLPGEAIRSHITNGGSLTCASHIYASGTFTVQALNDKRLTELTSKLNGCFDAGKAATGATLKVTSELRLDEDVQRHPLVQICRKAYGTMGGSPQELDLNLNFSSARSGSTGIQIPSMIFGCPFKNGTKDANSKEAQTAAVTAAKALGATALEAIRDGGLLKGVSSTNSRSTTDYNEESAGFHEDDWYKWLGA